MNRSWRNDSNNSSGFVYFNTSTSTNNSSQNLDNTDYMSFNESSAYASPKSNRFSPVNYSSPVAFQNSPRNYQGRHLGRNSFRYHNSPNRSFNSPNFNNSRKKSGRHQNTKHNNSYGNEGKRDMSRYLDHTCTKDPWAELDQNLNKTQETVIKMKSVDANKEGVEDEDNSFSSADEQESESDNKASSSDPEEGTV